MPERHIPQALLSAPDPFATDEDYICWHVLRRIGSVGLMWNKPGGAWLGIVGMKSAERGSAFTRLLEEGRIQEVRVEGCTHPLHIRTADKPLFDELEDGNGFDDGTRRASVLAPLDNLLWDRNLIRELFDFDYVWEVYKPESERRYGYYVLPVLCGDRLVARFEPVKTRPGGTFAVRRWWWEEGVDVTPELIDAVAGGGCVDMPADSARCSMNRASSGC